MCVPGHMIPSLRAFAGGSDGVNKSQRVLWTEAQHVQRPRGGDGLGVLEEQRGGQGGQNRVREETKGMPRAKGARWELVDGNEVLRVLGSRGRVWSQRGRDVITFTLQAPDKVSTLFFWRGGAAALCSLRDLSFLSRD